MDRFGRRTGGKDFSARGFERKKETRKRNIGGGVTPDQTARRLTSILSEGVDTCQRAGFFAREEVRPFEF